MTSSPPPPPPPLTSLPPPVTANGSSAPRPPNRAVHDRRIEEIATALETLESRRRFLQDRHRGLREQLSRCRADREAIIEERNKVEEQLSATNKEVNRHSEQLQKLRAGIPYLSEDRINEEIKTLEDQMMRHHYKRTEENKIILEVNRLKRSKKALKDHNKFKLELDGLRKQQRQIRERRDHLFRRRGEVKKVEDGCKRDANEVREELDKVKGEIDELFAAKRQAVSEFRTQETEYKRFLYEKKNEQRTRKKEERQAAEAEKQRELEEIKANAEPYEEELALLANLIQYCLRFELAASSPAPPQQPQLSTNGGLLSVPCQSAYPRRGSHESGLRTKDSSGLLPPGSDGSSTYGTPIAGTPTLTPVEVREGFVYKKEDVDDTLFPGVSKKTSRRNSRNERRNAKPKPLHHNPEIFSQFSKFGLTPPPSNKDVVGVIEGLRDEQQRFTRLAAEKKHQSTAKAATKPPPPSTLALVITTVDAPSVEVVDVDAEEQTAAENGKTDYEAKAGSADPTPVGDKEAPGGSVRSKSAIVEKAPGEVKNDDEEAFPSLPAPSCTGAFASFPSEPKEQLNSPKEKTLLSDFRGAEEATLVVQEL